MSLQSIFKRKTSYSTLLDTNEPGHASENNNNDHSRNVEEGKSPQNGDGGVNDGTQKGTDKPGSDLLETSPSPPPNEDQGEEKKKKKKSFFRTVKNIIFLKKLRSSAAKRQKRKRSVYEELDEDFGELDEADFEVVVAGEEGEEDEGYESIESAVRNGGTYRVDGRTDERIASQKRAKKKADRDSCKPKRVRFKKKKSTTKKVLKATRTTGKFIGRGIIYTGSSFQYLAPVTSPPPERTWKKWHERPSRPYRQSEFPFM